MSKNRQRLTPQIILELSTRIQAGAFEHVACESLGIPYDQYQKWLESGRQKRPRKIYRELLEAVHQAKAQARLSPEMEMRKSNPRLWLLQGPGKETSVRPGWSSSPHPSSNEQASESYLTKKLLDLIAAFLEVIKPYPDIREQLIAVLDTQLPEVEF